MATFKLNFTHGGSGTKEDPFRIPIIPFVKTPLKPLKCSYTATSSHGEPKQELFLVGVGTSGKFGVGNSNQKLSENGQTVTGEFLFYGREKFTEPERLVVRAIKYERKVNGQLVSGVSLQEPGRFTWNGNYNEYWFVSFTDEEQAAYEASFAPTAEEEKPALVENREIPPKVVEVEVTIQDIIDDLDQFDLAELKEIETALDLKLAELKGAVEEKEQAVVEPTPPEPEQEPEYVPEYRDGVNFNPSFEWVSDDEFIINVDLDRVDEFGGFQAFQFDIPDFEGAKFVELLAEGTYFDKTPENDGTFDEQKVINGWTWRGFDSHSLPNWDEKNPHRLRVGGFASSLNKITSDGRLARAKYRVTDPTAETFTVNFIKALLNGYRIPVNPKNPRVVVTKN